MAVIIFHKKINDMIGNMVSVYVQRITDLALKTLDLPGPKQDRQLITIAGFHATIVIMANMTSAGLIIIFILIIIINKLTEFLVHIPFVDNSVFTEFTNVTILLKIKSFKDIIFKDIFKDIKALKALKALKPLKKTLPFIEVLIKYNLTHFRRNPFYRNYRKLL